MHSIVLRLVGWNGPKVLVKRTSVL